jgi:hypothetical protein
MTNKVTQPSTGYRTLLETPGVCLTLSNQSVTAPVLAVLTCRAYFARTPRV